MKLVVQLRAPILLSIYSISMYKIYYYGFMTFVIEYTFFLQQHRLYKIIFSICYLKLD